MVGRRTWIIAYDPRSTEAQSRQNPRPAIAPGPIRGDGCRSMWLRVFADAPAQRCLDRSGTLALFEPRRNFAKIAAHVAPGRRRAHHLRERLRPLVGWPVGGGGGSSG